MANPYEPPKQKGFGQFVDSIFLLVLVYLALLAPLLLKEKPAAAPEPVTQAVQEGQQQAPAVTWQDLKQNTVQQAQWEKLGYTPETAKPIVENRFDYSIEPIPLIVTILVIVGYFFLVLRISDKEYRQVIAERFGNGQKS